MLHVYKYNVKFHNIYTPILQVQILRPFCTIDPVYFIFSNHIYSLQQYDNTIYLIFNVC